MSNENKVVLPEPVSDEQIKAVFLANGFTIKEGLTDLKPYVYQAARALLATGGQAQAVWDGKLPESLQRALNELRIDCKTDAVSSLEFEVRSVFEGMHTSLTTVKHMYHAAQKRLDSTDAAQPDPFAAPQAQAVERDALTPAARDVLAERARQVSAEGWTTERDDQYTDCQLAAAAASYAVCGKDPKALKLMGVTAWPWRDYWWKPETYRRNLEKAGALILAEIERIDRQPSRA